MKFGTRLHLPKSYPCAKFGYYRSISDVAMTSSVFLQQAISKVLHMFVNQVLLRYENFANFVYLTFWNARMLFITF